VPCGCDRTEGLRADLVLLLTFSQHDCGHLPTSRPRGQALRFRCRRYHRPGPVPADRFSGRQQAFLAKHLLDRPRLGRAATFDVPVARPGDLVERGPGSERK
jgi:hypothetical protein